MVAAEAQLLVLAVAVVEAQLLLLAVVVVEAQLLLAAVVVEAQLLLAAVAVEARLVVALTQRPCRWTCSAIDRSQPQWQGFPLLRSNQRTSGYRDQGDHRKADREPQRVGTG